jgi:mannose-6-phosphate isomerase class I
VITTGQGKNHISEEKHSGEILLCTHGRVQVSVRENGLHLTDMAKGQSVLIPAACGAYQITGTGVCYKAGTPL